MNFEKQNLGDDEKIKADRERVFNLGQSDGYHEDSIHEVALVEDKHRTFARKLGISDSELVNKLSDEHVTLALEKKEIEKKLWVDEMTHLKNKNAFISEVPQILSLETRLGQQCSMIALDLDFFKKVNDELGHDAGDQALKKLASIIRESVRRSDFVYKYGGDELVVFLPNTDSEKAKLVAEKIRSAVEGTEISIKVASKNESIESDVVINKTISAGVIGTDQMKEWSDDIKSRDFENIKQEMFLKADKALYDAKSSGRNKVISWEN